MKNLFLFLLMFVSVSVFAQGNIETWVQNKIHVYDNQGASNLDMPMKVSIVYGVTNDIESIEKISLQCLTTDKFSCSSYTMKILELLSVTKEGNYTKYRFDTSQDEVSVYRDEYNDTIVVINQLNGVNIVYRPMTKRL